jgi:hypothetical protein
MAVRRDGDLREQSRRGHPGRYPWADWCDGGIWTVRQGEGEDFDVPVELFRRTVHAHAKTAKLRSVTRLVEGDEHALDIQFFPRISEGPQG